MISQWRWLLKRFSQKLWVVALFYTFLGIGTAFLAPAIGPWLPEGLGETLGAGAVESVLTVLASSMLAVVTFSLGIMVSAFSAASASVTPRATALLQADRTAQSVLSTFLGSFLFSLIGLIALQAGVYAANDRLVLFAVTALVVAIIVLAILRWIAHLTVFGLMNDTISKVEHAARDALQARWRAPALGGHPLSGEPPPGAAPVFHERIGYLCHIDMAQLQELAETHGLRIHLSVQPGSFIHPARPVMWLSRAPEGPKMPEERGERGAEGEVRAALCLSLCAALSIDITRSFDQDPRFGLAVLAEIAERALSPAVNDPGTAIDILGCALRLLAPWAEAESAETAKPPRFDRVWVPVLRIGDVFEDIFAPIARDGAGQFEVQIRLQKVLLALSLIAPERFGPAARVQSAAALERSGEKMLAAERARLERLAEAIAAAQ